MTRYEMFYAKDSQEWITVRSHLSRHQEHCRWACWNSPTERQNLINSKNTNASMILLPEYDGTVGECRNSENRSWVEHSPAQRSQIQSNIASRALTTTSGQSDTNWDGIMVHRRFCIKSRRYPEQGPTIKHRKNQKIMLGDYQTKSKLHSRSK